MNTGRNDIVVVVIECITAIIVALIGAGWFSQLYLQNNKISIIFGEIVNNVKTTAQMVDNLINLKLI